MNVEKAKFIYWKRCRPLRTNGSTAVTPRMRSQPTPLSS